MAEREGSTTCQKENSATDTHYTIMYCTYSDGCVSHAIPSKKGIIFDVNSVLFCFMKHLKERYKKGAFLTVSLFFLYHTHSLSNQIINNNQRTRCHQTDPSSLLFQDLILLQSSGPSK
jgi:hypothetical protein